MAIKKRRITQKDWDGVSEFVRTTLESRKLDKFRKKHMAIWKQVDRMINMEPMKRFKKNGEQIDEEWRSTIELGELAKASEVITADVMRLTFPTTKAWFEAHSEILAPLDPATGRKDISQEEQEFNDKALRALMVQQHLDFGLKPRYELSVKEALHHGSYVAEVVMEDRMRIHEGSKVENTKAPVWKPYSMWNAYPDPSPSVIATDMFYTGSMILTDYVPLHLLKEIAKGAGWMPANISRIKKRTNKNKDVDTQNIELVKYYGDVEIKRQDGDIYLPNSKVILANDVIIYYAPIDLSFPPLIFSGYERMDVRDPYYTSPLMKMVPMQIAASQLANKYLDAVWLRNEPPIVYDSNDAQFVMDGGPKIQPGVAVGTSGGADFKEIKIGEPEQALQGLTLMLTQLQQESGVNAIRSGGGTDVSDKTATEINTTEAKAEIRTAEFVEKQERSALRPFLYMQHEYNKKQMGEYSFYNPEQDAEDFMRASQNQLPEVVHFEIVGSSGVLGEQRRARSFIEITSIAMNDPEMAAMLKKPDILKQAYLDGGIKNPERFLNIQQGGNPELEAFQQEAQAAIEDLQGQLQEAQQSNALEEEKAAKELEIKEMKVQGDLAISEAKVQGQLEIEEFKVEQKVLLDRIEAGQKETDNKIESIKNEKSINIMDSANAEPLGNLAKQMSELANKIDSIGKGQREDTKQLVKGLTETLSKPKSVKVERDNEGKITGAHTLQ